MKVFSYPGLGVVLIHCLFGFSLRAEDPPNIILFLVDDQGWSGTSVQMDLNREDSRSDFYQTPALERLAAEGMRFSQGYAPHPNCSSTRMSIQTGKSPVRLGTTDILDVVDATGGFGLAFYNRFYLNKPMKVPMPIGALPSEEVTIAEFIKEHRPEYATAHFGKWHMKGGSPSDHGYDEHHGETSNFEGNAGEPDPKLIGKVTDDSEAFIQRQVGAGKPFFLQVSHYAVHTPVLAKAKFNEKYEELEPGEVHTNRQYAAMTEDLDGALDSLLKLLDELGVSKNTYVIYTSDNGGEIGAGSMPTVNTPLNKGKTHTWEGGIRVPFIVRGPVVEAGTQSDVPVIGWDFFPTFAEWLGIEAELPQNIDGGSFAGLIREGGTGEVKRPTSDFVWYYPHYRNNKGVHPQASIRSGQFKLRKEFESGKVMLFDLERDLGESEDLAAKMPEKADELHRSLEAYLSEVEAELPVTNADYDPEKDLGLQGGGGAPRRGPRAGQGR